MLIKERHINRKCSVCDKELEITIFKNNDYSGGHFFGKMKIPLGEGEYKELGTRIIFGKKIEVVKWTGNHVEEEYWECDECYNIESDEI